MMRLERPLVSLVSRAPARVQTKLLVAFLAIERRDLGDRPAGGRVDHGHGGHICPAVAGALDAHV